MGGNFVPGIQTVLFVTALKDISIVIEINDTLFLRQSQQCEKTAPHTKLHTPNLQCTGN